MGRTVVIAVVIAAIVGAIVGFGVSSLSAPAKQGAQSREFYVFSIVIPFNDTAIGVPHDGFVPDRIVVNKGDAVTIHFYNTEDEPEAHTFTMDAPYQVNKDIGAGEHADITFTANTAGIFPFWCTYHLPTMKGELVVLG